MALYKEKEIECPKCKTIYDVKYPSFIRIPSDNDIKPDIVSGGINYHKCPNCFNMKYSPSPFLYVDDEKRIAIISNTYFSAIRDREELKSDFLDYKFYLSESPWITENIINSIDNGFDPLVLEFIKYDYCKYLEKDIKNIQIINSCIEYSDDGYKLDIRIFYKDSKDNYNDKLLPISSNLYNDYVNKTDKYRDGLDESVISPTYIKKLKYLKRNKEIEASKNTIYEFLQCRDEYDNPVLGFVQSFNENKFKEGDIVGLVHYNDNNDCEIIIAYVDNVIHMTDYQYYDEINDLPVSTYKITDDILEPINDDIALNNQSLKLALQNNFKDRNYNLLFNANIIVPLKVEAYIEDIINNKYDYNKTNLEYEENNKAYYSIYLEQSDIKNNNALNQKVTFKSALIDFFNNASKYDGIIINPDTDKFILPINKIFKLITNRIMTNNELMQEFLINATKEEIAFIGEDKYNLIKKVYTDNKSLNDLREELNLTKEQADYMLDDGYKRIQKIIQSKELM